MEIGIQYILIAPSQYPGTIFRLTNIIPKIITISAGPSVLNPLNFCSQNARAIIHKITASILAELSNNGNILISPPSLYNLSK